MTELTYENRIQRLQKILTPAELGDAIIFYNAVNASRITYNEEPTAKNKQDWEAARDGLDKTLATLEETHFPTEPMFDNIMAAVKHLQAEGYKVKKSKVYNDKKKGLLFAQPDGRIRESDLLAYIARAGLTRLTDADGNLDGLHAEKSQKEIEKLTAQVAKLQFDLDKDRAKYMLRADFSAEMAARAVVLEANFKNFLRTHLLDVIQITNGKPSKTQAALDFMLARLDEFLNEYANTETFQIRSI